MLVLLKYILKSDLFSPCVACFFSPWSGFFPGMTLPVWDLRSKSQYSAQVRKNTDQEKLCIWTLFIQCFGYTAGGFTWYLQPLGWMSWWWLSELRLALIMRWFFYLHHWLCFSVLSNLTHFVIFNFSIYKKHTYKP